MVIGSGSRTEALRLTVVEAAVVACACALLDGRRTFIMLWDAANCGCADCASCADCACCAGCVGWIGGDGDWGGGGACRGVVAGEGWGLGRVGVAGLGNDTISKHVKHMPPCISHHSRRPTR